jgi:DNA-binding beta-propeller fold protein YncE
MREDRTFRNVCKLILLCAAQLFFFLSVPTPGHAAGGFPIIGVLHAGERPEALAVDSQTHMLYIAYEGGGLVVGFDPLSGKVRWRNALDNSITDIQVDSSSHHVYVTSAAYRNRQSNFYILDDATGHVLFKQAVGGAGDNSIAFDSKRQRIYVTSEPDSNIYTFTPLPAAKDGSLQMQSTQFHIGANLTAIGVNSRLGRLYVADGTLSMITVLDEESEKPITTISVAAMPLAPLRIDENSGRVYVVCSTGQELDVIDGKTNALVAQIPVAPFPEGIATNTTTGRIYVADEGNKEGGSSDRGTGTTLTVIDGQTLDILGTFQIGQGPDGVVADPALHRIYVSVEDTGAVVELSDSVDIPLKPDATVHQTLAARQTVADLQRATMITLIAMALTMVGATLVALSPRWRGRGSPQTLPGGASAHSKQHSPLR